MLAWNKDLNMYSVTNARLHYSLMRLSYEKFLQTFPRASSRLARYGKSGVMSSASMLIICLFLNYALSGSLPLTLFIVPVVVSAWFGGLGPGCWPRCCAAGERLFSHGAALLFLQYGHGGLGTLDAVPGHKRFIELVDPDGTSRQVVRSRQGRGTPYKDRSN